MGLTEKDIEDTMQARPVAVVDLYDVHDLLDKMSTIIDRLEDITRMLHEHLHQERSKSWELILKAMLEKEDQKRGDKKDAHRTG